MPRLLVLTGTTLFPLPYIPRADTVLMVEDRNFCARRSFHQQKLAFVLGCMRDVRDELIAAGRRVMYFGIDEGLSLAEGVKRVVREDNHSSLACFETDDQTPIAQLSKAALDLGLSLQTIPSPMFLPDSGYVAECFATNRPALSTLSKSHRRRL